MAEFDWQDATKEQLKLVCSDKTLNTLSKEIAGYESYKYMLGLTEVEIEDIEDEAKKSSTKFYLALRKWKKKKPYNATFAALIKVFRNNNDGEAVRKVHKHCIEQYKEGKIRKVIC